MFCATPQGSKISSISLLLSGFDASGIIDKKGHLIKLLRQPLFFCCDTQVGRRSVI